MSTSHVLERGLGLIAEEIDWWGLEYTSVDEELLCPICRTAFVNPYTTECGHTFCHECLQKCWNSSNSVDNYCPIDRIKLTLPPQKAPFVVRSLLDELEVACPFADRGCKWKGKRWILESHVHTECEYVNVFCSADSDETVQRRIYNSEQVPGTITELGGEASQDGKESEALVDKEAEESLKDPTPDATAAAVDLPEHIVKALTESISNRVEAKFTAKIDAQAQRMANLETENRILKKQVDLLTTHRHSATELDEHILQEYERILKEQRETGTTIRTQERVVRDLAADNNRANAEINILKGALDAMRRQMFHVSQNQRRLFLQSSMGNFSQDQQPPPDSSLYSMSDDLMGEDLTRKRGQQKL